MTRRDKAKASLKFANAEGRIRLPANRPFTVRSTFCNVNIPKGTTFVVGRTKSKYKVSYY